MDALSKWMHFLIDPESDVVKKLEQEDEAIKHAMDELRKLSMDSEAIEMSRLREQAINDENEKLK